MHVIRQSWEKKETAAHDNGALEEWFVGVEVVC